MITKKSTSNKVRKDRFNWKSGDVQVYNSEADWRKSTKKKPISNSSGGKKK